MYIEIESGVNPNEAIEKLLNDFADYLTDNDVDIEEISNRNKIIYVKNKEGYDFAFAKLQEEDWEEAKRAGIHVVLRFAKGLDHDIPDPVMMVPESKQRRKRNKLTEALNTLQDDFDVDAVLAILGFKQHPATKVMYAYFPTTKTLVTEYDNNVIEFRPINNVNENDSVVQQIFVLLISGDFDEIISNGGFETADGDFIDADWQEFDSAKDTLKYILNKA